MGTLTLVSQLTIAELEQEFAPKKAAQTRLLASMPEQPRLVLVQPDIKGVTGAMFFEPEPNYTTADGK